MTFQVWQNLDPLGQTESLRLFHCKVGPTIAFYWRRHLRIEGYHGDQNAQIQIWRRGEFKLNLKLHRGHWSALPGRS